MNDTIITFDHVSYAYPEEDGRQPAAPAVHDVTLSLRRGDFTVILGRNGSGKSTLAKLCNGILLPTQGTVTVDGKTTANEAQVYEIRKQVGMVFQNPDNQIVATIVEDDVAFGPENLGVAPEEIRRRVDAALQTVGMYELRDREPHKLSGGQKQRVAIAGVLAMQTQCLILDESTAMLDPGGRAEVLETVRRLHREAGITVILITHFMEEAVQADRVIVMDAGSVIADGTPEAVFGDRAKIRAAGLEIPQAAQLADALTACGVMEKTNVLDAAACADVLERLLRKAYEEHKERKQYERH